ncbi:MAG: hypothetical protein RDV48_18950 [Candidatus Eremiobacteraeota bacterium]|nr:hypothetical protein [Candidatus Eremiobacteraeota bacterium]
MKKVFIIAAAFLLLLSACDASLEASPLSPSLKPVPPERLSGSRLSLGTYSIASPGAGWKWYYVKKAKQSSGVNAPEEPTNDELAPGEIYVAVNTRNDDYLVFMMVRHPSSQDFTNAERFIYKYMVLSQNVLYEKPSEFRSFLSSRSWAQIPYREGSTRFEGAIIKAEDRSRKVYCTAGYWSVAMGRMVFIMGAFTDPSRLPEVDAFARSFTDMEILAWESCTGFCIGTIVAVILVLVAWRLYTLLRRKKPPEGA